VTLLGGLVEAVNIILTMLQWLIIAAALVTWVSPDPRNPIVQFLFRSTQWILRPCRKILPPRWTGGIDFSPVIAILLIVIVKQLVIGLLLGAPVRVF
jgi:YggT family protein